MHSDPFGKHDKTKDSHHHAEKHHHAPVHHHATGHHHAPVHHHVKDHYHSPVRHHGEEHHHKHHRHGRAPKVTPLSSPFSWAGKIDTAKAVKAGLCLSLAVGTTAALGIPCSPGLFKPLFASEKGTSHK